LKYSDAPTSFTSTYRALLYLLDKWEEKVRGINTSPGWQVGRDSFVDLNGYVGPFPQKSNLNAKIVRHLIIGIQGEHIIYGVVPGFLVTSLCLSRRPEKAC
jgi:hypothetical protein